MADDYILSLKNISKRYPGVKALDKVSVDFKAGEVHALVGENGAGKSTIIKAISGAIEPDEGSIFFEGREFKKVAPIEAKNMGIEVVYQEFNLAQSLSIAENIFMGNPIKKRGTVDLKATEKAAGEILKNLGVDIDPGVKIRDITVAYMQLVEISKAISKKAKVYIMDEPTAALTEKEVEILFKLIRRLKEEGALVIYVSHRMEEIFQICDRITVMRDGEKIRTLNAKDTCRAELISHMVGRELSESYPQKNRVFGDVVLKVENLAGNGVRNISFGVKAGEILGFGGLVGSGRTETAQLIFGACRREDGSIFVNGAECKIKSPGDAIKYGIGLIPEDRKNQGVVLDKGIDWNITLTILNRISKMNIIQKPAENQISQKYFKDLEVKAPSLKQKVQALSGGNQQKVVLAKWLATDSKVLIFDEPTRGIDVGAKQEIYKLINELAGKGMAVIMISSDMEELLGMSDRLIVFSEGEITRELDKSEYSQSKVLELASGKK
ncbi:ribose transport system ATP-binding protein [Ruminiclostridium sufflavum DSM 19573]|uniref:Ribose transport system ATP-binding protein n=1 Tax=Ruminiclostridium sufflavum DSM 19573 TaxID=1121337 RepID=A0A318XTU6_9FIRM|nr:sugar ABC transporter ATP-binding protein [Ruminiclostridium sufflavum]PYG90273.1 ribose transport system ATP-binding protein [Ruminiclostridium sufflavum DSM 19573]